MCVCCEEMESSSSSRTLARLRPPCVCSLRGWGSGLGARGAVHIHTHAHQPTCWTPHLHSEHKAALDLARLYMAGNTTRKPPSASSDASESGGGARVTELTPAEARRARLKAKAEAAASSKQQVEAEAEQAADPAMAPHRFGGGGACVDCGF